MDITLNTLYLEGILPQKEIDASAEIYQKAQQQLHNRSGAGSEFLGWLDLPDEQERKDIKKIKEAAAILAEKEALVFIGIGGSYLGAKAVMEALGMERQFGKAKGSEILFAGQHISQEYHRHLLAYLQDKDYGCVVISKSGTTTEPAIAFRLLKKQMQERFPADIAKRIICITDNEKGALKTLADKEGYSRFIIPDNVGGRYSVLSPVGLLPLAIAGIDIDALLAGAAEAKQVLMAEKEISKNPALYYAAIRNYYYQKGYSVELMSSFEPQLFFLMEWWKQLFGESDGKESKGLFPASAVYSTDLHSLGQFVQEGSACIMETMLKIAKVSDSLVIPDDKENLDNLNYIAGKSLHEINKAAEEATAKAHRSKEMPVLQLELPQLDERRMGQLLFFFEYACAIGGYAMQINPFNQPGVEAYKTNMFEILGKEAFVKKK